ncbi:MAG: hypothetical protein WDM81_17145 [Rhizomicrobium sp.]
MRQNELTPEKLAQMLGAILARPASLADKAAAARTIARANGTERFADAVEQIARAA